MADRGIEGLLPPYLRRKRFAAIRPHLKGRVPDFGCVSGVFEELVPCDRYFGVDRNDHSLRQAMMLFPLHCFESDPPDPEERFDTIALLYNRFLFRANQLVFFRKPI
jgi:hypothetical protein